MENVYNTYPDFENNVFYNDLNIVEDITIRFRLDELLPVINLLDLLHVDSNKIRDLYYYHREILGELPSHYLEYRYKPKYKKREFNKKDIIDSIGQLPLFDVDDIF